MSPLRIERYVPDNETWAHVGDINPGDSDASMSANNPDGTRDVYLFGVDMLKRQGFIKKSIAGIDEANSETRVIDSLGFVTVATLNPSENYEIATVTDKSQGEQRKIRFTYFED